MKLPLTVLLLSMLSAVSATTCPPSGFTTASNFDLNEYVR